MRRVARQSLCRSGRARIAPAILLSVACALLAGCSGGLPDGPEGLPYRMEKRGTPLKGFLSSDAVDLDGDGIEEFVTFSCAPNAAYYYLSVRRQVGTSVQLTNQFNKPQLFKFSGVLDIDGDGSPEILTSRQVGVEWAQLTVLDVEMRGERTGVSTLAGTRPVLLPLPDTLIGDLTWDGLIVALDATDADGDGWSELVTFAVRAGLAKGPRGVGRADIRTGELVWFTPFAGSVEENPCVADFDEDGENEYAAVFNSPGNGVSVEDMTDSEAWVAVLDGDGSIVWRQQTGGLSAGGWPYCGDITGDGRLEVVTWHSYSSSAHSDTAWLTLWDGQKGHRMARYPIRASINGVALGEGTSRGSIFVCGEDGFIRRLTWGGRSLVCDRVINCVETPMGIGLVRVDPIPEPILIAMTAEGTVLALDTDLKLLALLRTDEVHDCHASMLSVTRVTGEQGAAIGIGPEHGLLFIDFSESPLPTWVFVVGALALVTLCCVGVPPIRRSLLAALRRLLIPRTEREKALDELLAALVRAGHGKLAATSTLRRLKQQLTMLGGLERAAPAEFDGRYREALSNVREIGLPGVASIHHEAARVGLDPSRVSALRRELVSAHALLRRLPVSPPAATDATQMATALEARAAALEVALESIRDASRLELSSNLMTEIRRAAGSRRADFMELGAELTAPTVSKIEGIRVLGTRVEVSFIVENLMANALAAVQGCETRSVDVSAEPDGVEVALRVTDTGTGIPPDMHERIFDDGVTGTHGGTGHGLAESRRILAKRGGTIVVARSKPGQGTTFEVRFQIVDGGTS